LKTFLQNNLTYQGSPRLQLEFARLQRHVDLVQQVYVTLSQEYEQARIQEVRNTPVITIVDRPEASAHHSIRLSTAGLLGLVAGLIMAAMAAFIREYGQRQRIDDADSFREFADLRRAATDELLAVPRGVMKAILPRRRA
jgi:hypothetical protein